MRILLVSNGHGEDAIGAALVGPLRARGATLEALPIVGDGGAYARLGVPVLGPAARMPSGGFVWGRPRALARDLAGGLVGLTLAQWRALASARERTELVLAIGDIVAQAFAIASRRPFVFLGCAKSEYYAPGLTGRYLPHERALMRHPRCKLVFARDALTAGTLQRAGIRARYLGNPMMDGLTPQGVSLPGEPGEASVLLLPGSREEAYANFALLREAARAMRVERPGAAPRFWAAIAPGLDHARFAADGWTLAEDAVRHPDGCTIHLTQAFAEAAHAADLAFAMAGTATEQVVGLGKPVISMPGAGPQFTASFARLQTRLLGPSVLLLPAEPASAGKLAWVILDDHERRMAMSLNGRERMGLPGASERMAEAILTLA